MERERTDVRKLSIAALREAYRNKETTPEEVIQEIVRLSEKEAGLNVWITPPRMERIRPYLDRLASIDPEEAPLWGIPFGIKDNIDLAGVPTTAACADYQYVPRENAAVVERLVRAGAIPVGKTNLDQFATGLVGTRSPYGEVGNALAEELISGGSSSGSAVAVARGQVAFALGTDTAGSGRVPAALNGIYGFKPALGAWSTKGVVPACASLDCVTVFAVDLEGVLEVDRVARGEEENDPWSRESAPLRSALPKKLLLPRDPLSFFGPYAQEYEEAWQTAVDRLERLGVPVEYADVSLFRQAAELLYDGPFVAERWAGLGGFVEAHPDSVLPVTDSILRSGADSRLDAASLFRASHKLQEMKRKARLLLKDAVLALPTAGGTWTREQVRQDPIRTNSELGKYTNHCNLLDLCGLAVPAGEAEENVPFGLTFFSLGSEEELAIGAATLWEGLSLSEPTAQPSPGFTYVAVCGLHMRGLPFEKQMAQHGARFVRETRTSDQYGLYKLPTEPPKPGLLKRTELGAAIELELWEMPLSSFGQFASGIPAPLGIGKVQLQDGSEVPGFVCESYATQSAEDITSAGGWRAAMK